MGKKYTKTMSQAYQTWFHLFKNCKQHQKGSTVSHIVMQLSVSI